MSAETLRAAVDAADVIVTVGPGGVGKTTTSAALGVAAARAGRRVIVMTVDPARRLADALGLADGTATDEPHHVVDATLDARGETTGELWALMLDPAATFDHLVREQVGTPAQAESVLANPVYQAISRSLAGAQEYMAIERLHQLVVSDEWDVIVIDTPPSRHAIDLLEAPDRLVRFLGHPVYRALTAGQRTFAKLTDTASSMFLWAVRRLAGPQIVEDTVQFFRSLANVEGGLRKRAGEVSALLRSEGTAFVVVTSPRAEAIDEATHLMGELRSGRFPIGGAVVNLVHPVPDELSDVDAAVLADLDDGPLADHVAWHRDLISLAMAERAEIESLIGAAGPVPLVEIPLLEIDVNDLPGLGKIADLLESPSS